MKLVPNANQAWRWWSVRLLAVTGALQVAWETLPPEALLVIPEEWRGYITLGLIFAAAVARVIDQGITPPAEEAE